MPEGNTLCYQPIVSIDSVLQNLQGPLFKSCADMLQPEARRASKVGLQHPRRNARLRTSDHVVLLESFFEQHRFQAFKRLNLNLSYPLSRQADGFAYFFQRRDIMSAQTKASTYDVQ